MLSDEHNEQPIMKRSKVRAGERPTGGLWTECECEAELTSADMMRNSQSGQRKLSFSFTESLLFKFHVYVNTTDVWMEVVEKSCCEVQ